MTLGLTMLLITFTNAWIVKGNVKVDYLVLSEN